MKLVILIFLILLLFFLVIFRNKENFNSGKYPIEKLIYENSRTLIYTIKNNDKYLYKKYKKPSPNKIKEEVNILNSTDLSPNVIDFGDDFYIIERIDMTLQEMAQNNMVNKEIIQKFIDFNRKLDLFKYKHLDLHWKNILWDNKNQEFKVIDWEHIQEQEPQRIDIPDRLYLSKKMDEYSKGGPLILKYMAKKYIMKKYDNEEIGNETDYIDIMKDYD